MDLCELETSMVYRASSKPSRAVTQRNCETLSLRGKKKLYFFLITMTLFCIELAIPCTILVQVIKLDILALFLI